MSTALERMREAKRKDTLRAKAAEEHQTFMAGMGDAASDMSTTDKLLAGAGQGMTNVARNVGNIVGLTSDEELAEAKARDEALLDTGAGSVGSFVGEMAGLAPLSVPAGAVVGGAKALTAVPKLSKAVKALGTTLPRASGRGLAGATTAAVEGGLAGGILADPGERVEGLQKGAAIGAGLNKTLGALGRKMGRGLDESKAAREISSQVEELTGKPMSLPVAQSAESSVAAYPHRSVLSMFPLARGGSKKLEAGANQDWGEAVLVSTFGKKNKKAVQDAIEEASGDLVTAGQNLLKTMGNKGFAANRKVLKSTLDDMKAGELLTPNKLDSAAKKIAKGDERPFYSLTSKYSKVMEEPLEESTVSGRRAYNKILNKVAPATLGAAVAGGAAPYLALTGAARTATSKPIQNFMMGRTGANRALERSIESIYADALRNAIAGQ